MIQVTKMYTWQKTASTWFKKSVNLLHREAETANTEEERWLVGYTAERLLWDVLYEADMLVPHLQLDQIEDVERHAKNLARLIKQRRQALLLANVEGRSPEEAAAFTKKAKELGARS